jgi:hypothetical protein
MYDTYIHTYVCVYDYIHTYIHTYLGEETRGHELSGELSLVDLILADAPQYELCEKRRDLISEYKETY